MRALTLQNPTAYKKGVRKIVLRQFFPGQVWNDALMNNAPCVDTRNENDKTTNRVGSTADCKKKTHFAGIQKDDKMFIALLDAGNVCVTPNQLITSRIQKFHLGKMLGK